MDRTNVFTRLQNIDPKVLYLLLVVFVLTPLVKPMGLPITITPEVQAAYAVLDKLPQGSMVLISMGTDPQTEAEGWPQALAFGRHLASKGHKMVVMALAASSQPYAERLGATLQTEFELEYGKDISVMAFRAGEEDAVAALANDFRRQYNTDYKNRPIGDLPMFSSITGVGSFRLVIDLAYKSSQQWFIRHVSGPKQIPLVVGVTAVFTAQMMPFYASGQIKGLVSGLSGAAAYERLIGKPGMATKGMDAQSMGHVLVLASVLVGNIAYYFRRTGPK
jgi:hypothetical protein